MWNWNLQFLLENYHRGIISRTGVNIVQSKSFFFLLLALEVELKQCYTTSELHELTRFEKIWSNLALITTKTPKILISSSRESLQGRVVESTTKRKLIN